MSSRPLPHTVAYRTVSLALVLSLTWSMVCPAAPAAGGQARPTAAAPERADGQRLFRAIFFLQGPLADEIPELKRLKSMETYRKLTPRQEEAIRTFQTRLMRELTTARPTFFETFEKALQSGDRTRISRALGDASQAAKDVLRQSDPGVARFLDRYETTLNREIRSSSRDGRASGPPDLKALHRTISKDAVREAERVELVWLKGFSAVGPSSSEPQQPDTDHNIAVVLLTFVAVVVIAIVWLAFVSPDGGGDLHHERLVNALATRVGGR